VAVLSLGANNLFEGPGYSKIQLGVGAKLSCNPFDLRLKGGAKLKIFSAAPVAEQGMFHLIRQLPECGEAQLEKGIDDLVDLDSMIFPDISPDLVDLHEATLG
jgi:hypothetical protein